MTRLAHTFFRLAFHTFWWVGLFLLCRITVGHLHLPPWLTLPLGMGLGLLWHSLRHHMKNRHPRMARSNGFSVESGSTSPFLVENLNRSWTAGRRMRRRRLLDRLLPQIERPLFLCFSRDGEGARRLLAERRDVQSDSSGEFSWHMGGAADWLDLPFAWRPEENEAWKAFVRQFRERRRNDSINGVMVAIQAGTLMREDAAKQIENIAVLRNRLNELAGALENRISVYVFVDGMDALYGWRSFAALLPAKRLSEPLGCCLDNRRPSEICRLAMAAAEKACRLPVNANRERMSGQPSPLAIPAMQAAEELRRLKDALDELCGQAFSRGNGVDMRGLFFGLGRSEDDGWAAVPPLAARRPSFVPACEPPPGEASWFVDTVTRRLLPSEAIRTGRAAREGAAEKRGIWLHAGTAGLLLGTLVLCWLMTFSFNESRRVLLSAAGRAKSPAKTEELQSYFELADLTRLRNQGWPLPRFGMTEPLALANELERRFSESYFDLKTVPGIEQVQDAALSAARSRDPVAMGNSLLMLLVTRDGICRTLNHSEISRERSSLLRELVVALSLGSQDDMRLLDAYFAWAGRQDWMPATHDALAEFERHLLRDTDAAKWLPAWVDTLPGLRRPEEITVCKTAAAIRPAWTGQGYGLVREMLSAVAPEPARDGQWREEREAILTAYRHQALNAWVKAADGVWDYADSNAANGGTGNALRRPTLHDDPATRFAALACSHLLPMFDDTETYSGVGPEIAWLRLWNTLAEADGENETLDRGANAIFTSMKERLQEAASIMRGGEWNASHQGKAETGAAAIDHALLRQWRQYNEQMASIGQMAESPATLFAMVRNGIQRPEMHRALSAGTEDRFGIAEKAAEDLTRAIHSRSGGIAWETLSPTASVRHLRLLAMREAALHLDAIWRTTVFTPCMLTPGGSEGRHARLASAGGLLEKFLTGDANGFWTWRGGDIAAASWNEVEFPFTNDFLEFCNNLRRRSGEPSAQSVTLPLEVRAVSVAGAVREHPVATEFVLTSGETSHTVIYRNYRVKKPLIWTRVDDDRRDAVKAAVHIRFPSLTASLEVEGEESLRQFVALFGEGECILQPEDFGKAAPALRRMGVERIMLQATMENIDVLFRELDKSALDLPRSIIRQENGPAAPPFPAIKYDRAERNQESLHSFRKTADEEYGES